MLRVALVVPQRNMTLPPVTGAVLAPRRVVSGGLDSFVIANAIVQEAGKYPPSTAACEEPKNVSRLYSQITHGFSGWSSSLPS